MIRFKTEQTLPEDAAWIRRTVFVEEQGFADEFDGTDAVAAHIVLYDGERPVATCRYFRDDARNGYVVGRIAVLQEFRGRSLGSAVLREAERQISALGGARVLLAAQLQARGFYEKQGYAAFGDVFYEEHCPHVWMCKMLDGRL